MTDLTLDRGNDRTLTIDASTSLVGVSLRFAVARRRGGDVLLETTTGTGDADGIATIPLPAADTLDLPAPSVLLWDLEGIDSEDARVTLARGRLYVRDVVAVTEVIP